MSAKARWSPLSQICIRFCRSRLLLPTLLHASLSAKPNIPRHAGQHSWAKKRHVTYENCTAGTEGHMSETHSARYSCAARVCCALHCVLLCLLISRDPLALKLSSQCHPTKPRKFSSSNLVETAQKANKLVEKHELSKPRSTPERSALALGHRTTGRTLPG